MEEILNRLQELKTTKVAIYQNANKDREKNYAHGAMLAYGAAIQIIESAMARRSNEDSGLNITVIIARFLNEQATEYKTEQNNIVVGLMQDDLYIWDFDGGRAMQYQWQTKKIIDEPLNGL